MRILLRLVALVGVLALAGFAWLWFAPCGFGGCAPVSDLERFQVEGSELLDVNGRSFARLSTVNRRVVPLDSLPPYLPKAFLAVEDQRFEQHGGVDWKRMVGAMLSNVRARGVAEGGSTISMQLARNLFPERLPYQERSIRRKFLEIRVARQIERAYSKPKILELYLNHIYLGAGAYGVEAAAQKYFGKPAAEVTIAEAALLGGLPKAPSDLNPRENRQRARERRNLVLGEMAKAGYISQGEAEEARAEPVRLAKPRREEKVQEAAYFVEQVRREVQQQMGNRFYTSAMRIHTTYDPEIQAAAEEELARQFRAVEAGQFGRYRHPTYPSASSEDGGETLYLQGAAVVMDARTGEVRALVGGRDFADSEFNRATQALRQPGSAFKPFVYLAALEQNHPPTEQIEDAPLRVTLAGGQVWEPRNYTGSFDGPITLREALVRSKNTVTVRLAEEVGMRQVIRTARDLGIQTPISDVPATALGSAEVRPIELISAYAPLANGGTRMEPHLVRRIEGRNGDVVWESEPVRERVADPAATFVLTDILRNAVDRGTGSAVRAAGFSGPAAGKTGTTNGATDVWFVGYTPELVAGVWMGLDRPATIVAGASGGTLAAPVWGRMMRRIYASRPMPAPWPVPPGVVTAEIERGTGLAVDAGCPVQGPTYTEYFVNAQPPQRPCYPEAQMPVYADADRPWIDEEWGGGAVEIAVDTSTTLPSTIDWPELEAIRQRQGAVPPPAPLPRSSPGVTFPQPPGPPRDPLPPPIRRREPVPEQQPPRLLGVRADSATETPPSGTPPQPEGGP